MPESLQKYHFKKHIWLFLRFQARFIVISFLSRCCDLICFVVKNREAILLINISFLYLLLTNLIFILF